MKIAEITLLVLLLTGSYNRDLFKHWSDLDGDGLNTRQEIVQQEALQGVIFCWYTGTLVLVKEADVDHIVPLSWAYKHGADKWTDRQREEFANDPENLMIVSRKINRDKGDKGPAEWLPPFSTFVPTYIEKFYYIAEKYKLR